MRKITLLVSALMFGCLNINAQQTSCVDQNGYVDSKNSGPTGYYTLTEGQEEKAAQTYMYSGPGKISSVRIHGNYPGLISGVPLKVGVYEVDANGRPTSQLYSTNTTWWWFNNSAGYMDVSLGGGGVFISSDFAITLEIRDSYPYGNTFQLEYTGDGEGAGEDLASLAGTSTGFNWSSAMSAFSKDGDFYLEPRMTNFINSEFSADIICAQTGQTISFDNASMMSTDPMFNLIAATGYSGSNSFYSWNFGDGSPASTLANPTHSYSAAGMYTVTLTTTLEGWNNTCSSTYSVQVSVGLNASSTSSDANCFGGTDGSITAAVVGGASPYMYSLDGSNYQTGTSFNGLSAGSYTVYVTDDLGCQDETTVTISEPSEIVINNVSATNASCGSSNGAILVSATGGTGALEYQLNSGTYQSSNSFSSLSSGFYTINVRDANGCITTTQKVVADQGAPTLSVISQSNVSCNGGNDGHIFLLASGGSGTLQYSINGGATWQTGLQFNNLSAGAYFAMVKDAAGCTYGFRVTLTEPEAIAFNLSATDVSCNGGNNGTISVSSLIGGTGSFTYSLNGTTFQSSSTFNNLSAGTYTVYARDIAGCMETAQITVDEPTVLAGSITTTPANCTGSYDGTILINATGGTGAYSYSLNGDDFQYDNLFTDLEAGSFTVTVSDENGCQIELPATITQPTSILATITTGSSTCGNTNGTMLVSCSGGSGSGYEYSLDGINFVTSGSFSSLSAGGYYVVVKDGNGCTSVFHAIINDADGPVFASVSNTDVSCNEGNDGSITVNSVTGGTGTLEYSIGSTWQTSTSFTGLEAGTYNLIVKDANGCVGENTVTITEPNAFVITSTVSDALCFGTSTGSVTINAAGGAGTLAYSINGGNTFVSSNTFNNLVASTYTVIVRDAAGCSDNIGFAISQPSAISINTSVLNITCNGSGDGMVYVNASGGTGTLEYSLDGTNYQSGNSFSVTNGGSYFVFVKDANACVITSPVTVIEPSVISVGATISDASCAGGSNGVIDLSVSGGVAPYTFLWDDFTTNEDNFNLSAGNYNVVVTDNNGCYTIEGFTVEEPSNPLILNASVTNTFNQMSADGAIDITVTGGTAPYTYLWDDNSTTEDLGSLNPGVYSVMVTDANGCSVSGTFVVSVATGINSNENAAEIKLYPNPANNYFVVDAGSVSVQRIEVLNVIGEVVFSNSSFTNRQQMNVADLANGIYMVRVFTNNNNVIVKRLEITK